MNAFAGMAPSGVAIDLSARLHLGFLDLNGDLGRRFGSIGLAISGPQARLCLARSPTDVVEGADHERAAVYLAAMRRRLALPGAHRLSIAEGLPRHAGLGSGTQLALGVAAALRRLHGLAADSAGDALALERGARSGIGLALFDSGGLVVDGGRGPLTGAPPIVSRMEFPSEWRVMLVFDRTRQGLHGPGERRAFKDLEPMPAAQAATICRLVLMQALPALAERDIMRFGGAIGEMQRYLGDYFAPAQGGHRYASAKVAAAVEFLVGAGAHGPGQSSWGPTGFAFAASQSEAERLAEAARRRPGGGELEISVVSGLNRGAAIEAIAAPKRL